MKINIKKYILAAMIILSVTAVAWGRADNNPVSTGTTQPYNFNSLTLSGAFGNPALTGLSVPPRSGLSLFPTSIALWSDKLAPPFNRHVLMNPLNLQHSLAVYMTTLFEESFGVNEFHTPEEVSEILTRELSGGIGLYTGLQMAPFAYAKRGGALSVRTYADVDMRIPEGFLLPLFSETAGLLAGNTLDISDLDINGIWASEVVVKLGTATVIPAIRDYLKLDKGAIGAGIKLVLGHGYFDMKAEENSALMYDSTINKYRIDGTANVTSIGTGIHGNFHYDSDLLLGNPISGQGWGLDFGTVFHNNSHLISIDIQDIGMIFWDGKQVSKGTLALNREFDLPDLINTMSDLFELDSLEPTGKSIITWLPAALNVGYSFYYDLSVYESTEFLVRYITAGANYKQQLVLGPGKNTYAPRLSVGGGVGFLSGYLPIRYGLIIGGPEELASAIGVGFDLKNISLDMSYKAIGSPILKAARGFEAAAGLTFRWGRNQPQKRIKLPKEDAAEPIDQQPPEPEPDPEPEPKPEPEPEPEPETPPMPELEDFPEEAEEVPAEMIYEPIEIVLTMGAPQPAVEPTVKEKDELRTSQRAVNFVSGGAGLTQGSFAALDEIARLLKQYPDIRYEIQGHTDSQGRDAQNLLLSAERAATVKKYLVAKGAPEESLIAIGYGRSKPIADNSTTVGRALNRRVEFVQILSQEQYDALKNLEMEMMKNMTREVFGNER